MGPEFVVGFATGQKVEARRSREEWEVAGYCDWTMRHGFYANMVDPLICNKCLVADSSGRIHCDSS